MKVDIKHRCYPFGWGGKLPKQTHSVSFRITSHYLVFMCKIMDDLPLQPQNVDTSLPPVTSGACVDPYKISRKKNLHDIGTKQLLRCLERIDALSFLPDQTSKHSQINSLSLLLTIKLSYNLFIIYFKKYITFTNINLHF